MSHNTTGDPRGQFLNFDTTGSPPVQAAAANQEDLAESMALIKDIVPGYGDGFIEACLKACNGNAQRAVNMLLEKKFPEPLAHMDPKMPKAPEGHVPRTLTETGDPRATWMAEPVTTADGAAPKTKKPDSAEAHRPTHGVSQFGDPRVAWVHGGADVTPEPHHIDHHEPHAAEDSKERFFKTGDPRAQ